MIGSHLIFIVKNDETGKQLKARLCPQGNRDCKKGSIRNESASARFNIIRLLLSLTTLFEFTLSFVDVKRAYLRSGVISREIYVRPPSEIGHRNVLWNLRKPPKGISEGGSQWMKETEEWMTTYARAVRPLGVTQMYTRYDEHRKIVTLVAKVTDDILLSGKEKAVERFCDLIKSRFEIRNTIIRNRISFYVSDITQQKKEQITM